MPFWLLYYYVTNITHCFHLCNCYLYYYTFIDVAYRINAVNIYNAGYASLENIDMKLSFINIRYKTGV